MRKIIDKTIAMATIAVAIFAIITACSGNGSHFKIDARFLNMNQASFYVYSPDGVIEGIDTIGVQAGRFTYEKEIMQEGIIVIVFPNYATMPVFVTPGASIDIEANAAHLRTMEITGTDDNEMFTEWRKNSENLSPPEMRKHAELFINDHPESPVARWLLTQHFVTCENPDYKKAKKLLEVMLKASDNNIQLARMKQAMSVLGDVKTGDRLPRFSAKDIDGNAVLNGKYQKGSAVICVWSSWNYESQSVLRQIASRQTYAADSLKLDNVLTICLDPDVKLCRQTLRNCGATDLTTVCDTMMWDSPLMHTLGFEYVPDNMKLRDGKIIGRHVPVDVLLKR